MALMKREAVFLYGADWVAQTLGSYLLQGATAIRDYLLKTYGEDAFSILIDEGGKSLATCAHHALDVY